jgi:hypothetical protein
MSEGERELYRRGAMSELSTQLSKVADGRDVTRIFQNPLMREKLMLILPDQATANTFAKQLAEETQLHRNATFVRGGSQTADKMAEHGRTGFRTPPRRCRTRSRVVRLRPGVNFQAVPEFGNTRTDRGAGRCHCTDANRARGRARQGARGTQAVRR